VLAVCQPARRVPASVSATAARSSRCTRRAARRSPTCHRGGH